MTNASTAGGGAGGGAGSAPSSRKLGGGGGGGVSFSVLTPPPSNIYVSSRRGGVLTRGMVLKSDHFASGRMLDIHVNGAPNFRQVRPTNLYGVGQPTVSGYERQSCSLVFDLRA